MHPWNIAPFLVPHLDLEVVLRKVLSLFGFYLLLVGCGKNSIYGGHHAVFVVVVVVVVFVAADWLVVCFVVVDLSH